VPAPVPPTAPTGASPNRPVAAASNYGHTNLRIKTAVLQPKSSDFGAFRNPCAYSHMAFDDPIVLPGQPGASHLHVFFGNTSTHGSSTNETLLAAKSSTCAGGIANLSAYWTPAMVDTTTGRGLIPTEHMVYYKTGYNDIPKASIQAPPNGLRIVAGNKATENKEVPSYAQHHNFECFSDQLPDGRSGKMQAIPACPVGGYIKVILEFPNCWDGVNLDSPDHRSHMTYTGNGVRVCPASHPVPISLISFNTDYEVTAGQDTRKWRLSSDNYETTKPGGYSMHGDAWVNWQKDIAETWTVHCVRASVDCRAFLLGDGMTTY